MARRTRRRPEPARQCPCSPTVSPGEFGAAQPGAFPSCRRVRRWPKNVVEVPHQPPRCLEARRYVPTEPFSARQTASRSQPDLTLSAPRRDRLLHSTCGPAPHRSALNHVQKLTIPPGNQNDVVHPASDEPGRNFPKLTGELGSVAATRQTQEGARSHFRRRKLPESGCRLTWVVT